VISNKTTNVLYREQHANQVEGNVYEAEDLAQERADMQTVA
jgi:hypothetical protein